jgi:hypothetical protein
MPYHIIPCHTIGYYTIPYYNISYLSMLIYHISPHHTTLYHTVLFLTTPHIIPTLFSGTQLGTTCKHATVSCPNNQTTYPVSCPVVCPSTYALKGVASVSCTTAGTWTSVSATYCRRINDPPTQVMAISSYRKSEKSLAKTYVLFFIKKAV